MRNMRPFGYVDVNNSWPKVFDGLIIQHGDVPFSLNGRVNIRWLVQRSNGPVLISSPPRRYSRGWNLFLEHFDPAIADF